MTTGYDHRHPRPEPSHEGIRAAYVPPCSCVFLIPGLFCTAARQVSLGGRGGGLLISRGGLLGTQHPTPEPLPSPFLLVPPATQSRISWGPSGPVLQLSEQPEPPSPQERRLEGTSACVGSSTGSSEALPAKEPCALDTG